MPRRDARTSADDVLLQAVRAAMAISVRAADELGDISAVQLRAMTVLHRSSGANLAQLAQSIGVTVSTTSRLVDRLVAAGLVDRRPSPQSRREISLSLTRTGDRRLKRYDELRLGQLRACLARVPADERTAVVRALEMLTALGGTEESATAAPG